MKKKTDKIERQTHVIDASDKILGRLATKIAILLQGKNKPDFVPYKDMGDIIIIKNINKIKFSGKKLKQDKYFYHSGYPGGFKEIPVKRVFDKNPGQVLKKAVLGMLPKNKLRTKRIKRLRFN
jgi:large subunit ribosomal protein L13